MLQRLTNDITPLPLSQVTPDPAQPRKHMDGIDALAASITADGLLQPITVAITGDDSFTIITGERRYLAHKLAGLDTIDCVVVDAIADPATTFIFQLLENMARADMTPGEEATAIHRAVTHHHADPGTLAQSLSRSIQFITDNVKLGALPTTIKNALGVTLTKDAALLITSIDTTSGQLQAFKVADGKSTKQARANIKRLLANKAGVSTGSASDPEARSAAKHLDQLCRAVKKFTTAAPDVQAAVNARTRKLDDVAALAATLRKLSTELDNAIAARRAVVTG